MSPPQSDLATRLLAAAAKGSAASDRDLFTLLYERLRGMAAAQLRNERPGHTLQPTALVHEAWVKLVDLDGLPVDAVDARGRFLGIAARAMRQILVDHARKRAAVKRGGDAADLVTLGGDLADRTIGVATLLDLDTAIEALQAEHPRLAKVAELRVFGGLTLEEVAAALAVSHGTAKNDWSLARAMLSRHLSGD